MAEPNDEPIPGYRLIERLGSGGFGEVWKASAPGGMLKALKLVFGKVNAAGEESQVAREIKGMERIREIRHPFLLSMERMEVVAERLVIVTELADKDLADRLEECRRQGMSGIPRDELLRYLREAAEGLDYLNGDFDTQHLDIKPSNIFLIAGHAKVADFGLAKNLTGMRATVTGGMTPVYAAPETFNGWAARQTDQYSLAIVFQELLTGSRPFPGPTAAQYMMQHLTKQPDLGKIPDRERKVMLKALAKDPVQRFGTCLELIEALVDAGRPRTVTLPAALRGAPQRPASPPPERFQPPARVPLPTDLRRPPAPGNAGRSENVGRPPTERKPDTRPATTPHQLSRMGQETRRDSPIIGIDLGTSNSVVAVIEGQEPRVLANQEGARLTPSVVAILPDGQRLVGQAGRAQATVHPRRTVASVKRFMGRRRGECEADAALVPYELCGETNDLVRIGVDGKEYPPPEISGMVLRKLKEAAEDYLGCEVSRAVVTVPAYFNDAQRQATKDAGAIAGLTVERIVNEPTAAALAFGLDRRGAAIKVAVFDLGGGTFDITLLKIRDNVFDVLATNGDTRLGGDDFDLRLAGLLAERFMAVNQVDPRSDPIAEQRLREAAEAAKRELSGQPQALVHLPFLLVDANGPKNLSETVTRAEFERLTQDLVDRCRPPCEQALADAKLKPADIDEIVLVGGSSRMPHVRQMVRELFGKEPCKGVNPDEAIAQGAAIQGGILDGKFHDMLLLDVTPLSLGLEIAGGMMSPLIHRNTTVPTVVREVFTTARPDQEEVGLHILQGERQFARDNRTLDKFWLENLKPKDAKSPQVEVTFALDANGILQVSAKDLHTGQQRSVKVESCSGLSKEQIERMRGEAEQHATGDRARKDMLELRAKADAACRSIERALQEAGKAVADADRDSVRRAVDRVRAAATENEPTKLHLAMWQLDQATRPLMQEAH